MDIEKKEKAFNDSMDVLKHEQCLEDTIAFIAAVSAATDMRTGRGKADFLCDRLAIAAASSTLFNAMSAFRKSLNVGPLPEKDALMLKAASYKSASAVLRLLRAYPAEVISIVFTKKEEKAEKAWNLFNLTKFDMSEPTPLRPRRIDIRMTAELTEPLVHGDESKLGNAILFRRRMTTNGLLPFVSANSIGHALRVALAEDFLEQIGLHPKTTDRRYAVWFNEFLHNGGKLGGAPKEFEKKLCGAAAGGIVSDGINELRDMFPWFSLLGGNAKNSICGRISVKDLRPVCAEYGTGRKSVDEMLSWEFGTTPDPLADVSVSKTAAKKSEDDGDDSQHANSSMIYAFQTLKVGTVLEGGFDLSLHANEIERSCLGKGILLLQQRGKFGAKGNKGFGGCEIICENMPDHAVYDGYIQEYRDDMIKYIEEIGAFTRAEYTSKDEGGPIGERWSRSTKYLRNLANKQSGKQDK